MALSPLLSGAWENRVSKSSDTEKNRIPFTALPQTSPPLPWGPVPAPAPAHAHTHRHTCTHTHAQTHTQMHTRMHTHIHPAHRLTHIHTHHTCTRTDSHTCIRTHTHTRRHTCAHTHIHARTHTCQGFQLENHQTLSSLKNTDNRLRGKIKTGSHQVGRLPEVSPCTSV